MQRFSAVTRVAATRAFSATAVAFYPVAGKCVSWVQGKGFGFVEDADKKQHFVHNSAVKVEDGGYRALSQGQDVEFDVVSSDDGRTRAENVTAPNGAPLPSGERPPRQEGGNFRGGRGGGGGGGYRGGRGGGNQRQNDFNDDY